MSTLYTCFRIKHYGNVFFDPKIRSLPEPAHKPKCPETGNVTKMGFFQKKIFGVFSREKSLLLYYTSPKTPKNGRISISDYGFCPNAKQFCGQNLFCFKTLKMRWIKRYVFLWYFHSNSAHLNVYKQEITTTTTYGAGSCRYQKTRSPVCFVRIPLEHPYQSSLHFVPQLQAH